MTQDSDKLRFEVGDAVVEAREQVLRAAMLSVRAEHCSVPGGCWLCQRIQVALEQQKATEPS